VSVLIKRRLVIRADEETVIARRRCHEHAGDSEIKPLLWVSAGFLRNSYRCYHGHLSWLFTGIPLIR
jgi:hypothetical protein